jgi:DNA-binding NarL/FixJ family response regulator
MKKKINLTPREEQVFTLILKGKNNVEISDELGVAYNTGKLFACRVLKKLGCNSKNELMAKYL